MIAQTDYPSSSPGMPDRDPSTAKHAAGHGGSLPKSGKRPYDLQQKWDRVNVVKYIDAVVGAEGQRSQAKTVVAPEERWSVIRDLYRTKMRLREGIKRESTARLDYPEKYNENLEFLWLQKEYSDFLGDDDGNGCCADQDDEEPPLRGPSVKVEDSLSQSERSSTESSDVLDSRESDGATETDEDEDDASSYSENVVDGKEETGTVKGTSKKRKWSIDCEVCTRGLGIEFGCYGTIGAEEDMAQAPAAGQGVKRRWLWVGGEMVVRPCF